MLVQMFTIQRVLRNFQMIKYIDAVNSLDEKLGDNIRHHTFTESARSGNADVFRTFAGSAVTSFRQVVSQFQNRNEVFYDFGFIHIIGE